MILKGESELMSLFGSTGVQSRKEQIKIKIPYQDTVKQRYLVTV